MNRFINNPGFLNPNVEPWPDYPGANQFIALGGRTVHWGAVSPRLLPYYLIAEQLMNVNRRYARGSALQDIFLRRLRASGYSDTDSLPMAVDLEVTKYGNVHSNVFFSSIIFLAYALNLRPFDVSVNTRALQVITENGKAAGVAAVGADRKTYFIKGKTVVLSASSFETPRILLNSGIRGEAVGRYLTNQSFITARARASREQFPEVLGISAVLIPGTEKRLYQLQIHGTGPFEYYWYHYKEKPQQKVLEFSLLGFGNVLPRVDNSVALDPGRRDDIQLPKLTVHFSYSQRDQAVIEQMAASMMQAAFVTGLTFNQAPKLMLPGQDQHESGTCRMGDDPGTSAANRYGQIHGISGLYAADNSVLPFIGAANPTLTTSAAAIRTADVIVQQLK